MVKLRATLFREDASVVHLESPLVCFNGNGDWLLRHGLHEGIQIVLCDILVAGHAATWDAGGARILRTSAILRLVRVAFLRTRVVFLKKGEPQVHGTTFAALVSIW